MCRRMLHDKIQFAPDKPVNFHMLNVEEYPFHIHSEALEIIFVVEGTLELTSVNNIIRMSEGDIYINSPNELHRLSAYTDSHHVIMLIHVDIAAYRSEFPDLDTYQFANGALENNSTGIQILGNYIKKLIPGLLDEKEKAQMNFYEVGSKILKILIQEFQCYYLGKYYPEASNIFKGNDLQINRIRRVVDYIYRNYSKQIKIEDLAKMEHISTYHLTYILKNGCGVGFRMFLNMARVERSAIFLLEDEMGLQQLAYECGFSKYEYFNETFKKVFRMTPRQYKQKYQNETIAVQKPKFSELEREEKEFLLQKFYRRYEEINLDLSCQYPSTAFKNMGDVNLIDFPYDHILCYPLLKQLKEEIFIERLGIGVEFLCKYRNNPKVLHCILLDFRKLQVDICIYISDSVSLQELRGYLELLNDFELLYGRNQKNQFEFFITRGEGDDTEKTNRVSALIAVHNFTAYERKRSQRPRKNPLYRSGYMPCYILDTLSKQENFLEEYLALIGGEASTNEGGLALMSAVGIKTPVYHLLYLLKRMGNALIRQGKMYFITQTHRKENIQILAYYYDEHFDRMFENAEEAWEEDPTQFGAVNRDCDQNREINIHITNIFGHYALRKYKLTAEDYSSKYGQASFLSFENLSEETVRVLNETLSPEISIAMLEAKGDYSMEFKMRPFEILLLSFEKL